jgi:4-carboxymuconolactone decarboxylase
MDDETRLGQGMRVRREVLGDAHVDRAMASSTAFTEPFQDFITRYAWGDVWSRPGLDRASRSMVTLAVLTALGRDNEIAMHVRAALRNGLTPEQISEVLLHTAVYAGVPAANRAFAIAQEVLREEGEQGRGRAWLCAKCAEKPCYLPSYLSPCSQLREAGRERYRARVRDSAAGRPRGTGADPAGAG